MVAIGSSRLLFFLFCALVHVVTFTISQPDFFYHLCLSENGNYTTNSTYQANLNSLLSSISSNSEINYGFYNFSADQGPDKVNAIALCREDINLDVCRSCINDSISKLTQLCPYRKEAIGWYDTCMLRYSNRDIFHIMDDKISLRYYLCNPNNVSSLDQFNQVLETLLDGLKSKAASGDSLGKFAVGYASAPDFKTIYALVQCTPDLSEQECKDCLVSITGGFFKRCNGKEGVRVVSPSCILRFETFRFYDPATVDELPVPSPPSLLSSPPLLSNNTTIKGNGDNFSQTVIIATVVPALVLMIFTISTCIFCRKRNLKENITESIRHCLAPFVKESFEFDIGTIRAATENFSEAKKLGQGGFGAVYKGTLPDGQQLAVKRLFMNSKQGEVEFKNEVTLVARLQHRNLVKLLGFCLERKERILVYEFLPNSSLDHFIFDPIKREDLDWERRYKIIEGIARGLLYLHEDSRLRIIHRDLKASNILLDSEMNPKISDFGTARLFEMDQTHIITNRVVGTLGYMAPEYVIHRHFSVKSDVFSFGVLVLELLSGQKRSCLDTEEEIECLLTHAWKKWYEGTASNLIDPTLKEGSRNEMLKCLHIGLLCVQESISDRPTIASVIYMLNSNSVTLPAPAKPGFFMQSSVILNASSSPIEPNSTGSTESDQRRIATAPL
ncbi:hypothetical protein Ddye_019536 [Dipteronia dyeriana]|uniref:Cysteine-rich receptor-like protein kinase 29 n=1 Tax=Dipteronia dyeriana TaxID=168575 RepID=A0AAD9WV61_9ROSI|nr:hypothetical protein Ddye_019536 [Dipteronia dyeriana]